MFAETEDTFIIAEIGGNHEGDFDVARNLLRLEIGCGVNSVKFQIYTGETLVNEKEDPHRVDHFNKFALTDAQYIAWRKNASTMGSTSMLQFGMNAR